MLGRMRIDVLLPRPDNLQRLTCRSSIVPPLEDWHEGSTAAGLVLLAIQGDDGVGVLNDLIAQREIGERWWAPFVLRRPVELARRDERQAELLAISLKRLAASP
jgi:hypothetical protein